MSGREGVGTGFHGIVDYSGHDSAATRDAATARSLKRRQLGYGHGSGLARPGLATATVLARSATDTAAPAARPQPEVAHGSVSIRPLERPQLDGHTSATAIVTAGQYVGFAGRIGIYAKGKGIEADRKMADSRVMSDTRHTPYYKMFPPPLKT